MNKSIFIWILTLILLSSFASAALNDADVYLSFSNSSLTGDDPADLSGNGNGGTTIGATVGLPGILDQSFSYDGDDTAVDTPIDFDPSSGSWTVSTWIDPTSVSGTDNFVLSCSTSGNRFHIDGADAASGGFRVWTGVSGWVFDSDTGWTAGSWQYMTLTYNTTTLKMYRNAVEVASIDVSFSGGTGGDCRIGNRADGLTRGFDGNIDEFSIYSRQISTAEISTMYGGGIGFNPYASSPGTNFTITVTDAFDNSALVNLTANITFSNGSNVLYVNSTGNFIQTGILINESQLINITLSSSNYFDNIIFNYNLSNSLSTSLNQSFIGFNLTDIAGNPLSTGNITILGQTEDLSFIWNLKEGSYNATANSPTFNARTQEISVSALDIKNITIGNLSNVVLNITAIYSLTGSPISNFTINATGQSTGYNLIQSTTNGLVSMDLINDTYFVSINAPGFVLSDETISVQTDTDFEFELFQIGDLRIDVFNTTAGDLFSQNVTLKLQNATTQRTFTLENGSDFITGLNYGVVYTLIFSSPGFSTNLYNILYDETQNANVFPAYLTVNNTQEVIYRVTDTRDVNQENALVVVERFVNDTRVEVGSQLTDVTGQTTFLLDISEGVRITISKSGFTTEVHNLNAPLSNDVSFQITLIAPVNYTNRMTNVEWSVLPSNTEINPDIVNFTFNVNAIDDDLVFSRIRIFNGSSLVATFTDSNSSGGVLVLPFNVSAYVNGSLTMEVTFQKDGFEEFVNNFVYIVRNRDNSFGSFLAVRIWFQNNTDLRTRIQFWLVLFALGGIIIASGSFALFNDPLKGIILIMPYVIITGWLVAINYLILGFLSAIMIFGIVLSKRSGGLS